MTADELIEYYGCKHRACKAIGVSRQAFDRWIAMGYIPLISQLKFEKNTSGQLKTDKFVKNKPVGHEKK